MKPQYDSAAYKAWYAKNAEKKRAAAREHYSRNRDLKIEYSKRYRDERPGCWRKSHLKRLYGITEIAFTQMLSTQSGKCAICKKVLDSSRKSLKPHIDHDHSTGKVRGLLCSACNISVGHIEKAGFLEAALKYLGKH